jgi:hypothetical protein
VLDKRISANGNPKANVAVDYEGLGGEQGTDVCEGGISSEQALGGRVCLGRRDTLDENLGLVIEVQASVLLENENDIREYLERNGELDLDVTVVGVCDCAGIFGKRGCAPMMDKYDVLIYYSSSNFLHPDWFVSK